MSHNKIKKIFNKSISNVESNISRFSVNPESDFTRKKKLPVNKLISFLILQGASSTKNELLDFFDMSNETPSASALNQQRAKLLPEALKAVFNEFNTSVKKLSQNISNYRFLAADGSTFTFFSHPKFATEEYYVSEGHSAKGFYSMHLNAFFDLQNHTYTDAIIQPVHNKNEFRAFCDIVDRHEIISGTKNIYIGDRGYCSYNNMAHVIESGQFFLFRAKDINSKGITSNFVYPESDSFDTNINVSIVRSNSKKISIKENYYKRFIEKSLPFDYLENGSLDSYDLSFRVVRFPLSENSYECIITNLPSDEFSIDRVKEIYFSRWGIESSFRKLKYTIGLSNFHSYKPQYIQQEIWAKMIAYNITETLINLATIEKKETKYAYKVNFSRAAHICRIFLRHHSKKDSTDVMFLLNKELIPIRNERQFQRLKTAHFRRPRYFLYRPS